MSHLKITEVVLVDFNIAKNNCQQHSGALYTFVPEKLFGQLLDISPTTNFVFLKTFKLGFSFIEVLLTDKHFKPLEIKGKINVSLVIN